MRSSKPDLVVRASVVFRVCRSDEGTGEGWTPGGFTCVRLGKGQVGSNHFSQKNDEPPLYRIVQEYTGIRLQTFREKMRRAVRASEGEGREKGRATDAEDNGERVLWEDTETGTCGLTETGSDRTTDDDDGLG